MNPSAPSLTGPTASARTPSTAAGQSAAVHVTQVHAVGTPSPRCAALLRSLPAALYGGGRPVPVTVHAGAEDTPWQPAPEADTLLLVFIDAPGRALAPSRTTGADPDLQAALVDWRDVATLALRSAHRYPRSCVLVDVAVERPDLDELFATFGLTTTGEGLPLEQAPDVGDAVDAILADRAAAMDPANDVLYEELRVSCRWPAATPASTDEKADVLGALIAYRASMARRHDGEAQAAQIVSLTQEQELLIQQVQQLEKVATSLQSKLAGLRGERQVPAEERDRALNEARLLRREGTLRERVYRPGAPGPGLRLRAEAMRLLGQADSAEHRHLDFSLPSLVVGERKLTNLRVRLLDHHGRPGLGLFAPADGLPLLGQWETHGEEAGRAFMLLIPSDPRGRALIQHMGTSDWRLVCTLAQALSLELSNGHERLPAGWRTVASRLGRQLSAQPPRLRYDQVVVKAPADGPEGALEVSLADAVFGAYPLNSLRLRWWPTREARQARLQALAPPDGEEVSLASWPSATGGLLESEYTLPVGASWSMAGWAALPSWDRELILALLDALPGAARQAAQEALPSGWTRDALADAAGQLNGSTRSAQRLSRWRQTAARLWRRSGARAD